MNGSTAHAAKLHETDLRGSPLPTVVISPHQVSPASHSRRDMPVNELGAADFDALLRSKGRYEQQAEAIKGLLSDVATDRMIHPIVVRPDPDGRDRYQLVSGWLVWSAAVHLGKESVHALVWDGDDLEAAALAYRLNHHRLQMKKSESTRIAGLVASLLAEDSERVTYRDVAKALGCSLSWAHKLLHDKGTGEPPEYEREEETEGPPRRPRGRPRVTPVFTFELSDPRGWESSVRLRVILEGRAPAQELRLQRSEEFEGWRDVAADEFLGDLSTEIGRLLDWLDSYGEESPRLFFPRKNNAPCVEATEERPIDIIETIAAISEPGSR